MKKCDPFGIVGNTEPRFAAAELDDGDNADADEDNVCDVVATCSGGRRRLAIWRTGLDMMSRASDVTDD
ncbi:hypothetical protein ACOMHN_037745 [Nucella lapillus]